MLTNNKIAHDALGHAKKIFFVYLSGEMMLVVCYVMATIVMGNGIDILDNTK